MLVREMLASFGDLMLHAARKGFKTSCRHQHTLNNVFFPTHRPCSLHVGHKCSLKIAGTSF